jgi:hypothetical protein
MSTPVRHPDPTRSNAMPSTPNAFRLLLALLVAVVVATVWGSIVQTQYNLAALAAIGTDIPTGVWATSTVRDIVSGFSPTYGGYIVAPALLVAFLVAWWVARRAPGGPTPWFALAGVVAIAVGIPLVNWLSPVALLVGASRDVSATLVMALGGALAGLLFCMIAFADTRRGRDAYQPPPSLPVR